mgnify:CR=1 FL=1
MDPNYIILDQFTYNGQIYYKDDHNRIWDMSAELVGVIIKIDELGNRIEQVKPKTPQEKLEMRSLDSYPFNQHPQDFFSQKQEEMRQTGKNEYVLTKDEVESYGKEQIMKSFNPDQDDNEPQY